LYVSFVREALTENSTNLIDIDDLAERINKKINDTQDQAIWDAISKEHDKLFIMYDERVALEGKHQEELHKFISQIGKQEEKVQELCEGKIKFYTDSYNKLILDATDRENIQNDDDD